MNEAAAANGGTSDINPVQNHGFMYGRDMADPDGSVWDAFWMDSDGERLGRSEGLKSAARHRMCVAASSPFWLRVCGGQRWRGCRSLRDCLVASLLAMTAWPGARPPARVVVGVSRCSCDFPVYLHYLNLRTDTPEHELQTDVHLPLKQRG